MSREMDVIKKLLDQIKTDQALLARAIKLIHSIEAERDALKIECNQLRALQSK